MAKDIGKLFEKELEACFRILKEQFLLGWHRLPDTGAAGGNIIQAQPSDYLLMLPPGSRVFGDGQRVVFLEAKASEKKGSLTRAAMQPSQRSAVALYSGVLRLPYLIFFYDAQDGALEVWEGVSVLGAGRMDPEHRLARFSNVGTGAKLNRDLLSTLLSCWLALPDRRVTLSSSDLTLQD